MKYISEFDLLNPENFIDVTETDSFGDLYTYKAIPRSVIGSLFNSSCNDVTKVTRCKNCIHHRPSPFGSTEMIWCSIFGCHFKPEFYCGHGDKKHG